MHYQLKKKKKKKTNHQPFLSLYLYLNTNMVGMIGNKTLISSPNALQNIKIIFIHNSYYCRMASRCEVNYELMVWIKSQNQTTDFSLLHGSCHVRREILPSRVKQLKWPAKNRTGEEGRREGTRIINATGHRPFLNL